MLVLEAEDRALLEMLESAERTWESAVRRSVLWVWRVERALAASCSDSFSCSLIEKERSSIY
jgi:hypothetical protein